MQDFGQICIFGIMLQNEEFGIAQMFIDIMNVPRICSGFQHCGVPDLEKHRPRQLRQTPHELGLVSVSVQDAVLGTTTLRAIGLPQFLSSKSLRHTLMTKSCMCVCLS